MNPVLEFQHVTKIYGGQKALDDVSLSVEPGQVVALLGENGAGKTTALRILLGLTEADGGRSQVLGMDSRTQGQSIRRQVGYVPDSPALYKWMTVAEIGWFTAAFYPIGYLDRYHEFVKQFELPENRKLSALSKGMLAKVSLALAMSHEPKLLVLDEPTSGLDPMVRRQFLESMVDVAAAGRTVLLSSHQIVEVERVADYVAIIRQGRLVLMEKLEELKTNVREVTITLNNGTARAPAVPGLVIRRDEAARQCRLLVRDLKESDLDLLHDDAAVSHVELRRPSLEEIFVGYMHSNTDAAAKEVSA